MNLAWRETVHRAGPHRGLRQGIARCNQHPFVSHGDIAKPLHRDWSLLRSHRAVKTMTLRAKRETFSAKSNASSLRSLRITRERLRPIVELAVAAMAQAAPNVTIQRGTKVRELITGTSAIPGVPDVAGVRTTSGEEIRADLVVDAMGRRSPACEWIVGVGGRSPIEHAAEDCNFVYFTRFFRDISGRAGQDARSRPWACSRSLRCTGTTTLGRSPCILRRRTRRCGPCVTPPHSTASSPRAHFKHTGSTATRSRPSACWREDRTSFAPE